MSKIDDAHDRDEYYAAEVFTLDVHEPVAIDDFVAAFSGLASHFERFIRREHPELEGEVKVYVYVKEGRKGSMVAEFVPLIPLAYQTTMTVLDHALIAKEFAQSVARNVEAFTYRGGRAPKVARPSLFIWLPL